MYVPLTGLCPPTNLHGINSENHQMYLHQGTPNFTTDFYIAIYVKGTLRNAMITLMCNYLILVADVFKMNELVRTPTWCHTLSSGKVFNCLIVRMHHIVATSCWYLSKLYISFSVAGNVSMSACQHSREQLTTLSCYYCWCCRVLRIVIVNAMTMMMMIMMIFLQYNQQDAPVFSNYLLL
jgi:hypothetical protein